MELYSRFVWKEKKIIKDYYFNYLDHLCPPIDEKQPIMQKIFQLDNAPAHLSTHTAATIVIIHNKKYYVLGWDFSYIKSLYVKKTFIFERLWNLSVSTIKKYYLLGWNFSYLYPYICEKDLYCHYIGFCKLVPRIPSQKQILSVSYQNRKTCRYL